MKATSPKRIDLTDRRFGRLVVLRYIGGPGAMWECLCDCGIRKNVAGGSLRRGMTQSCGCLHRELVSQRMRLDDLTGQRFHRLTVTGLVEMRSGESIWSCLCDCGNRLEVRGWSLRRDGTKSCGCLHRDVAREPRTDQPTYSTIHTRIRVARGPAKGHRCIDCGEQAEQWSYDHSDPDQLVSALGHPYSVDLDRYAPRCCSCHRTYDAAYGGVDD